MALAAPHRWIITRDFLVDLNGTKDFKMTVDDCRERCYGSCGLPPDMALMQKEGSDPFDERADRHGWTPAQRKLELWFNDRLRVVSRIQWIEDQVNETMLTGKIDLDQMSPKEQGIFLHKLSVVKERRKAGDERRAHIRQYMVASGHTLYGTH